MQIGNGLKIFSGNANRPLAQGIAEKLGQPLGKIRFKRFIDGEIWVQYDENIRGCDLFIIQPTNPPAENLIELLIMIDAARRASAKRITTVIPYFGYARQDRKDQPRVSITAKLIANIISHAGADRVLTIDLHTPQIQGFFDIPMDHLATTKIFTDYFRQKGIKDLLLVAPDLGRFKIFAETFNVPMALVIKRRVGNDIEIQGVVGDVKSKNCLLIDDILSSGNTLLKGVAALRHLGANDIYVACTHALLSDHTVLKLQDVVTEIVITDTVAFGDKKRFANVTILSAAPLLAEAIKRIHQDQSVSVLFENFGGEPGKND